MIASFAARSLFQGQGQHLLPLVHHAVSRHSSRAPARCVAHAATAAPDPVPTTPKPTPHWTKDPKGKPVLLSFFTALTGLAVAGAGNAQPTGKAGKETNAQLNRQRAELQAQLDALQHKDEGEPRDPIHMNQDTADATAATATGGGPSGDVARTSKGTKSADPQLLGAHELAVANVDLLDVTREDERLESIRRSVQHALNEKLAMVSSQLTGALRAVAATFLQELWADEDSHSGIKQAYSGLTEPSPDMDRAMVLLTSRLDEVVDLALSCEKTVDEDSLELATLLAAHKRRSTSRANKEDFYMHCLDTRDDVLGAKLAASKRFDYELAYNFADALRDHECQLKSFLDACDKVGFLAARDAYMGSAPATPGPSA